MADINSVDMQNGNIAINLNVSKGEYELLNHITENLLLIPTDSVTLNHRLTTGKLGNSNRIMMPKKILKGMGIINLDKKVPAMMFKTGENIYLLIKIKESSKLNIPVFGEDQI